MKYKKGLLAVFVILIIGISLFLLYKYDSSSDIFSGQWMCNSEEEDWLIKFEDSKLYTWDSTNSIWVLFGPYTKIDSTITVLYVSDNNSATFSYIKNSDIKITLTVIESYAEGPTVGEIWTLTKM